MEFVLDNPISILPRMIPTYAIMRTYCKCEFDDTRSK